MLKSMTGFGRGEYENEGIEYLVEIKSVNHRYYDLNIRLPRQYTFLEDIVRKEVSQKFFRGKIDINIIINNFNNITKKVLFNERLISEYLEEAEKLEKVYGLKNDLSFSNILNVPEATCIEKEEKEEEFIEDLKKALFIACNNFNLMKEAEGENLKKDIISKIDNLKNSFMNIESRADSVVDEYKNKLRLRIAEFLELNEITIDESRLLTEVAIFADRSSIDEEITRFKSHILQLLATLELNESVGKKIDFIIQEMNREVNTIGSKSNDLIITNTVIELKNVLEQIREQIQNIE